MADHTHLLSESQGKATQPVQVFQSIQVFSRIRWSGIRQREWPCTGSLLGHFG